MSRGDEREHEPNAVAPLPGQPTSRWSDREGQCGNGQPGAARRSVGQHSIGQHSSGQPSSAESQVALLTDPPQAQYVGSAGPGREVPVMSGPLGQPTQPGRPPQPGEPDLAAARSGGAWPDICDQFGLHLLVLAEQLRTSLDELEVDEADPERLHRLYKVDHAVTRMRRSSRDLRTLAGRSEEELAGFTTSLLDVIRMAASAIERYTQVSVGRVTELAVLGYAADDVGALMAALLDNATRYSPGTVTVSGHLLEDGGVMFRVEDTGIGFGADQVATLNAALAGPVPDVDERTGHHTGFPVVHRIARKHSIAVRLASRPLPSSGTVAMVTLPPHLLSEIPAEDTQSSPGGATPRTPRGVPDGKAKISDTQSSPGGATPRTPRGVPDGKAKISDTQCWPEPASGPRAQPSAQSAARPSPVADMPRRQRSRPAAEPQLSAAPEPRTAVAQTVLPQISEVQISEPQATELPRREPASLRGGEPRPAEAAAPLSQRQQEAARRAFADELSAFAAGSTGPQGTVDGTTRGGTQTAAQPEEGGQS